MSVPLTIFAKVTRNCIQLGDKKVRYWLGAKSIAREIMQYCKPYEQKLIMHSIIEVLL